jgi:hypothetical protein
MGASTGESWALTKARMAKTKITKRRENIIILGRCLFGLGVGICFLGSLWRGDF